MQTETEKIELTVKVANQFNRDITLCLEPWADEYTLPKDEYLTILAQGPKNGLLEIEYSENRITIYGWSGSTCEIIKQD